MMAATAVVKVSSGVEVADMLPTTPAVINARMAAGVSCGIVMVPGIELVSAPSRRMVNAPKSTKPIPLATKGASAPENISAANDISTLTSVMPTISPAVRLETNLLGWNSSRKFFAHMLPSWKI